MSHNTSRRIFLTHDDDIETIEIFGKIRAAGSDDEVASMVAAMDREGKSIFGNTFSLRFDRSSTNRDMAARIFLRMPSSSMKH